MHIYLYLAKIQDWVLGCQISVPSIHLLHADIDDWRKAKCPFLIQGIDYVYCVMKRV